MSKCPLVGWENVKLSELSIKGATLAPAKAAVMSLAKQFILNPIMSAALDAIEAGQDMADMAVRAGHNLIDSISPVDWLAYAASATAEEIYEVAQRELTLHASIMSILNNARKISPQESRYARISAEALRNIIMASNLLRDAANADTYSVLRRYFDRALSVAEANHSLLSADAIKYLKSKNVITNAASVAVSVKEGKIKDDSEALWNKLIANAISGAAAVIRASAMDELNTMATKLASIARIVYMYSGLNFTGTIYEAKMSIDEITSKLEVSINSTMQREAYPLGGKAVGDIDKAITEAAREIKNIQKRISGKISQKAGYYILSISPDFNPGGDLFEAIGDNPATTAMSKSDTVGALLNVAPYSSTPNSSLTIYGSGLKLPILTDSFNACAAALSGAYAEMAEEGQEQRGGELNAIKASIRVVNGEIDYDPYTFSDSLGMSAARLDAGNLKSRLSRMRKSDGLDRLEQKINNDDYLNNIREIMKTGIEKKIHEPALGLALLLRFCIKSLLPGGVSNGEVAELKAIVKDRMEYLEGISDQIAPIRGYRDIGCEGVMEELRGSGLGFVADAARYGKIATGAISLAAGVGGLANNIYEIATSCLPLVPEADRYKDVQRGVKNIKEKINKAINAGMRAALKPLGVPYQLINSIKISAIEEQRVVGKIKEMTESSAG
jgi:hypothetical protein